MHIPRAVKWLLAIGVPLLALAILFRWDWFIPMVESRASAALGRPVTVGHLHVRLGRVPEITLTDMRIANPEGFPADPPFAVLPRTVVAVEAWPLISAGRIVVPSVALHQPALELLGREDGTNNYTFETLTDASTDTATGDDAAKILRVSIVEGRSHVALEALEADFNLLIATQEPEGQDPTITLRAEGTYAAQPITGELVGGALLALQDAARPWPVRAQIANGPTRVTLEGTIENPLALRGADLRLTLAGPDMKLLLPLTGVPLPTTPAYRLAGRLDFGEGRARFHELQGTVGRTDLGGEIIVAPDAARPATEVPLAPAATGRAAPARNAARPSTPATPPGTPPATAPATASGDAPRPAVTQAPPPGPSPNRRNAQAVVPADRRPESTRARPDVTARLRSNRVDLKDLAGFIGGDPQPGATNARAGRTLPDAPLSLPRIRAANVHLVYDGARIEGRNMPLDNLHLTMDIIDGVIQVHPLRFGVGEGRISAEATLTPQEDGALRAETQVQFQRVDVSRLLGATGVAEGGGTLGGRAQLTGSGKSLAELLARGDGALTLTMAGGNVSALLVDLAGLRLGNAIFSVLGLPDRTRIECFVADLGLQRGVLNSRAILLDTEDVVVTGTGNVNLARERLDLRLNTASKGMTIGALPTAINITGSFADPSVVPDLTELGIRGGLAAALGFVALPLAILPTIQFGIGDDPRCRNLVSQAGRPRQQRAAPPQQGRR